MSLEKTNKVAKADQIIELNKRRIDKTDYTSVGEINIDGELTLAPEKARFLIDKMANFGPECSLDTFKNRRIVNICMYTEIETIWEDPKPNRNVPPIYIIISVNSRGLVPSLMLGSALKYCNGTPRNTIRVSFSLKSIIFE